MCMAGRQVSAFSAFFARNTLFRASSTIQHFKLHLIGGGEDSSPVNTIPDATVFGRKPDK